MLSENIKVSEVSDILRKQLEGIDTRVQLDEIGTVLQVSDGVARIYGLRNAEANELLEFDNGIKALIWAILPLMMSPGRPSTMFLV